MLASLMIYHFEIFFISLFSYFCDIGNTDENLSSNVRVAKGRMRRERQWRRKNGGKGLLLLIIIYGPDLFWGGSFLAQDISYKKAQSVHSFIQSGYSWSFSLWQTSYGFCHVVRTQCCQLQNFYWKCKMTKGPVSKYANNNIKKHISAEVDFSIVLLFINMGGGRMIYEE